MAVSIRVNNKVVPYVEVAYDYARSPMNISHVMLERKVGVHSAYRSIPTEEVQIPIIISRRGGESLSWDVIIEKIYEVIMPDIERPHKVILPYRGNKYFLSYINGLTITEEHDFVLKGTFNMTPKEPFILEDVAYSVPKGTSTTTVKGQYPVIWQVEVDVKETASKFEIEAYKTGGSTSIMDKMKVVVNQPLIAGDKLMIDFTERKVLKNGKDITNSIVIMQTNFKRLDTGNITVVSTLPATLKYVSNYY